MNGNFIISLDFELHWGAPEKWDLKEKSAYFLNTREVIIRMLDLFEKYDIRVTWATVGFLFASTIEEATHFQPSIRPTYLSEKYNYYDLFKKGLVGKDEQQDPFHYGNSIIKKIISTKGQELASHTFCHYYCNEIGQTAVQFDHDLKAAQLISDKLFQKKLKSLVFPRNQFNNEYLEVLAENKFNVIRVNPDVWFWNKNYKFNFIVRAFDTLFPVSKSVTFKNSSIKTLNNIVLLPASRFFRPYTTKERLVQNWKLNRIKKEMLYAARKGESYHLWWHPHNFGDSTSENLNQLVSILEHYKFLNSKYNFQSLNMGDFSREK
jgi:peptidoglycan/xylan/chitin deacetylase (PgdA/CDA1 family)